MSDKLNIKFSGQPLSYGKVILDVLNDFESREGMPFLIYEDSENALSILEANKSNKCIVYLLDTTALSNSPLLVSVIDLLPDDCMILVPWSNRINELRSTYPERKFYYLPLPVIEPSTEVSMGSETLICFTGPLESRLSETIDELKELDQSTRIKILNVNQNEALVNSAVLNEGIEDIQVLFPKSVNDVLGFIRESGKMVFPHNTSIRDLHWSYLYALAYGKEVILALRSDLESVPSFVPRYYLGDRPTLKCASGYAGSLSSSYIREVHPVEGFLWELQRLIQIFILIK